MPAIKTVTRRVRWIGAAMMLLSANAAYGANEDAVKIPSHLSHHLTPELIAIFEPGALTMPAGGAYPRLEYRLFQPVVPPGSDNERFPLLVFFNGHGRVQMTNGDIGPLKHLQAIIFDDPQHPQKYPFYLVAIRCPVDEQGTWLPWFESSAEVDEDATIEPIEATVTVVDSLIEEHSIDEDRVSLVGISSGGNACWELAARYPGRFAAAVPTGSIGGDPRRLSRMQDLPVWAFHSSGDNPEPVRRTVNHLQEVGGNARLTIISNDKHACWNEAFQDYDVLEWTLAQSRSDSASMWPSDWHKSARWQTIKGDYFTSAGWGRIWENGWPRAVPVLAVVVLVALYRRELRLRKLKTATAPCQATQTDGDIHVAPTVENVIDETAPVR